MAGSNSPTGAYLIALTPDAAEALRASEINIPFVPFRVGRESRRLRWTDVGLTGERRMSSPANNDLYLSDEHEPMNVSREHFLIDRDWRGFFIMDRGSSCGTLVEGRTVGGGGGRAERAELRDHDVIIVGTSLSRHIFKFRLE